MEKKRLNNGITGRYKIQVVFPLQLLNEYSE